MENLFQKLSGKVLKIVYFLITKRQLLKKIIICFLILINLIIYFFFIYNFILYLDQSKDYQAMEKELTARLIDYQTIHSFLSPLPLEIVSTQAIFLKDSKYNLVCLIRNPNSKWLIESLDYKFILPNFESKTFKSFVLPEEEKFLVAFNENIPSMTGKISCEITNIVWQRIKSKDYYLIEIPKSFFIKDLKFSSPKRSDEKSITFFKFVNPTIYNFWEVDLLVFLYQGKEIVSIEKTTLKNVKSKEEREIKIVWPQPIFFYSEIKIQPEINVFDPSVFIPPSLKLKE